MLAGTVLDQISSINDLGVMMDKKMKWDSLEDCHSSSEIHTL
jgi:hypothetical protein